MKPFFAAALALCVAPVLLAAAPDVTPSASGTVPMSIDECHLDYSPGGLLPLSKTVGPLHITFTNESKQTIVEAKFDVNMDGNHVEVKDVGSYAPDVEIKKMYRQLSGGEHFLFSRQPQPTCSLAMAKFADGTVWAAPATPVAAASPAAMSFDRFVGSWNCASAAGSSVTMTFEPATNGIYAAHTAWKNGPAAGAFDHTFTQQADGTWKTSQVDATKKMVFEGTSPGFADDAITFDGIQHNGSAAMPERETLRFTSQTAFEHTWYAADSSGNWHPTSFTECTKV